VYYNHAVKTDNCQWFEKYSAEKMRYFKRLIIFALDLCKQEAGGQKVPSFIDQP